MKKFITTYLIERKVKSCHYKILIINHLVIDFNSETFN